MADFRIPGRNKPLSAREINRLNAAVRSINKLGGTFDPQRQPNQFSWYVLVRNDSGFDRSRFDTMAIRSMVWPLDDDGSSDVVFAAIDTDSAENVPIVLVEDIAVDQVGWACAHGVCLANVKGTNTNHRTGAPNYLTNEIDSSFSGAIKLLSPPASKSTQLIPVILGAHTFAKYSFTLLEDVSANEALAKIETMDKSDVIADVATVRYKWGVLDGARAGYEGDCTPYGDSFFFDQGPCVIKCESLGSIAVGIADTGKVGDAFNHSVQASDIDANTLLASGLPPGLTMDAAGDITGTPTSSGIYHATITATAPSTKDAAVICTITKILTIEIEE